jgi:small subunit ribosomal protein S19
MGRAIWKGPYINPKYLKNLNLTEQKHINFISRNSKIIPQFFDLTFKVYNGKSYVEITIVEDMVGHKFGEFIFTRAKFSYKKKKKKKNKR